MSKIREIMDLYDAAEAAYDNGQYLHSVGLYQRASMLAAVYPNSEEISGRYAVVFQRSAVDSLCHAERLREALAALAPLTLEKRQATMRSCCIYGTTSDQILIGQALPVGLATIEKAFGEAEAYARSAGSHSWRSKSLHLRAQLLYLRGMFEEARAAAQEGWAIWREGCPAFYATTHLKTLFDISLALRQPNAATNYLAQWEQRLEEKRSIVREARRNLMQSKLARMNRRWSEAVDYARRAVHVIELADWSRTRYEAHVALVRALLVACEHERARDVLARLMHMRRSESGHDRYAIQLLRGDYHLSRARVSAGLAQGDDEYDVEFPPKRRPPPGSSRACHEVKKARAAYKSALSVGRWIDEQLQCDFRQREVTERLARADFIGR